MAQVLATRIDREVMQALSRAGSPIHSAAYVGNVEALRRELDRGVSANVTINEPIAEDNGLTPLHLLPNDGRRRSRRLHRRGGLERLPPEIVMRVVEFWAHVGHY